VTLRAYSPFLASFFAAEVLRELGIALVLVAVATISIEAARVRAFSGELSAIVDGKLEQIEKTAADAIMRGPLPKSYYEHVKRLMLLKPFLRSDWRINLVFNDRQDYFEVLFEQHFRITNLTSIGQTYSVVHHESPDQGGGFPGLARIRYARARHENAQDWEFNEAAPDGETLGKLVDGDLGFERNVGVAANISMSVETASVEHARLVDTRLFIPPDATTGLVCVCEHPSWLNVELDLPEVVGLPDDFSGKVASERLSDGRVRTEWQFPFPIVPSAAAVLSWWPAKDRQPIIPPTARHGGVADADGMWLPPYWQETGRNEAPDRVGRRFGLRGEFLDSRRNTSIRTHSFRA
jgi:hypothetical protein